MEPASHARIDHVTVEGLEDVFTSPDLPAHESVAPAPARPFLNAAQLLRSLEEASPSKNVSPPQNVLPSRNFSPVQKSETEQSAERALATAKAIARCLDVRSEAVIEHHTTTKPKSKKGNGKKKTVEEWRIKWTPAEDDTGHSLELISADPSQMPGYSHEHGLFDHVWELLRQNSKLIAKLEAATYRIGYLEAELETLRSQAGFSDCDAQVAELPHPKPAIRAISERCKSEFRENPPGSRFSSSADFWRDEPVLNGSEVPFEKIEEEPLQIESVTKPAGQERGISNAPNSSSAAVFFNWLPPRA